MIVNKLDQFNVEEITNIVNSCNTIQEISIKIGYSSKRSGKVLSLISNYLKINKISTSHLLIIIQNPKYLPMIYLSRDANKIIK